MIKECSQCKNNFEALRATAKYCSASCRKLAFQQNGKVSVPEEKENAKNRCQYCGTEIEWELQTTCYACVKARL